MRAMACDRNIVFLLPDPTLDGSTYLRTVAASEWHPNGDGNLREIYLRESNGHMKRMILALMVMLPASLAELQAGNAPEDTNSLGMKMIPIESGSFTMGSLDGDFDEQPQHPVRITCAF